jgi:hypothetical protein
VVSSCLLKKISVLTPATAPAEPLARVCLVEELPAAAATPGSAAGEVIYHPPGAIIRRPGLGRVLGMR